ncbi:hypothetical protein GOP47_0004045 [Adiantum capillus-veneris]|uniref:DCD domain-containing protein n=1 Tax=Adiantum capillus-veneris TaxID=13818 RepID=A0A9D4V8I3_ADICA|nr:hypothetical protein GOP47_0004045 [Adiantum capillus-veneris]
MARKGKLLRKPSAGGPPKGENAKPKNVGYQNEKSKGKLTAKNGQGQVEAAKKQIIGDLGGFIFMCNASTKADCFKYRVFGLNEGKKHLVEQVRKGMRLFLFDVDLRLLYGIYVATSQGTYKLEREAFGGGFPWQVRFSIQKDCLPLPEDMFQAAIKENYIDQRRFKVELKTEQVHRLVKLFRPLPNSVGRSPPRPRMAGFDEPDVVAKVAVSRPPEIDRHAQERLISRHLSPRATYETSRISSDPGLFPPLTKYESAYSSSDRYRAEKQIPSYSQSLTKYAQLYPPEERRMLDARGSDDLYLGREPRLQQDVGSLVSAPLSLSAYNADPLRSLSDLRQPRARDELLSGQPRARDEFLSVYSQGSTLGADLDPLYRQRLRAADARADVLDRRVGGLDPLVESAYSGGLSSDLLRGRASDIYASSAGYGGLHRMENGIDSLSGGLTSYSGLAYRGDLLPQSRYYGSSGY